MRFLAFFLLFSTVLAATELQPGQTIRIPFPDLPQPLAGGEAELVVQLPQAFHSQRNWPVFLWLNGGTGGAGINTAYSSNVPFIHISMPLFKKPAKKGDGGDSVHLDQEDSDIIWKSFSTMLAEFDRLVPNQDRKHSLVGGYSNGGHCIGVLASHYPEFVQRFQGYMLCDGGGYMFLGAKCLAGRTLLVSAGDKSPIFGRQQVFYEEAKRAQIDATWLPLPGQGHETPSQGKTLEEAIAWVRDQVAYGGLKESAMVLTAAIKTKRWPIAVSAYRDAAGIIDERRPEWPEVQAGLVAIEAACAAAADKLSATASSKDLRSFINAWQPAQALAPVHKRAEAAARSELTVVTALTDVMTRRKELLRLLSDWRDYEVRGAVVAELDVLATAELARIEAIQKPSERLKALRKFADVFSATPTANKAEQVANALGEDELPLILAEKSESTRMSRLKAFIKNYRGLACAEKASNEVLASELKQALAVVNRLSPMAKSKDRTRVLMSIIDRYPGTEPAKLAQAQLDKQ